MKTIYMVMMLLMGPCLIHAETKRIDEFCQFDYSTMIKLGSIDPEIRENEISHCLAYRSGEAADVLRILTALNESEPKLRNEIIGQLIRSERKEEVIKVLKNVKEKGIKQNYQANLNEMISGLEAGMIKSHFNPKVKVRVQAKKVVPILSKMTFSTFVNDVSRNSLYSELVEHRSAQSEILFRFYKPIDNNEKIYDELKKKISDYEGSLLDSGDLR